MLIAIFLLTSAATDPGPAPVRICNDMNLTVGGVWFEAQSGGAHVTLNADLRPGACADIPAIAPGDYVLRFDERSGDHAMMCARRLTVKAGDVIHVNADDGSSCMM
ncbi:MAG TPA: hypothetical protein VG407_06765 [Caulobacteraceae bacterium]|nr:hypothetical protein [Caulobacteraceae bacterium]